MPLVVAAYDTDWWLLLDDWKIEESPCELPFVA